MALRKQTSSPGSQKRRRSSEAVRLKGSCDPHGAPWTPRHPELDTVGTAARPSSSALAAQRSNTGNAGREPGT